VVRAVTPGGSAGRAAGLEVIALNCGSSSVKGARYGVDGAGERRIAETSLESIASVDRIGEAAVRVFVGLAAASPPDAVGHRIVHGGPTLRGPALVDDGVMAELRQAVPFAPLHLPAALAAVDAVRARAPGVPQVVCFDTSFHATLPETQWRFAIPRELTDQGIRRYGFHGLSYEYVVRALGAARLGRAVIAHLGNGASLCAVRDGRSVATTMGFTPTGGVPMGTRTGDLDPGVLVHLVRAGGMDADQLERVVDLESGLLALGGTSDMRELLERRVRGDGDAAFAVDVFCERVAMTIGAYATCLGSLDTIVFTAGIGERAVAVRADVCARLAHLGVRLDEERNERSAAVISDDHSVVTVRVVPTDEDAMIARHTVEVLRG
jgi:acetate kinase